MARIGRHVASQIEEAEARAELLSHARDELAETAEARIRPPAMAILGYADTLASETVAPASNAIQRRYLEELRKQALTLVQRLPEITVLSAAGAVQEQSQQNDRTAERVTLPTLMHEQVAEQRGLLALTEIDVDPSITPAELAGDPVNLRRAVNNLLSALALLQQRDSSGETRVRIGQSGDRATASLTTGPLDPVAAEQASSLLGQSDPGATKLLASQPSAVALFAASALLGLQNATLTFALTGDGQAPHAEIEVNLPLAG
jgi:hypothetical protein